MNLIRFYQMAFALSVVALIGITSLLGWQLVRLDQTPRWDQVAADVEETAKDLTRDLDDSQYDGISRLTVTDVTVGSTPESLQRSIDDLEKGLRAQLQRDWEHRVMGQTVASERDMWKARAAMWEAAARKMSREADRRHLDARFPRVHSPESDLERSGIDDYPPVPHSLSLPQ